MLAILVISKSRYLSLNVLAHFTFRIFVTVILALKTIFCVKLGSLTKDSDASAKRVIQGRVVMKVSSCQIIQRQMYHGLKFTIYHSILCFIQEKNALRKVAVLQV